jgi:EAL domain-containing protein (putative c-di-GMP-specific phosphodiesterase class I)
MWDRMAEMGVDQAQGFLIARALPAGVLPMWLDVWAGKAKRA